jgi:hypothetical protein
VSGVETCLGANVGCNEDFSCLDGDESTCTRQTQRLFLREGARISHRVVLIEVREPVESASACEPPPKTKRLASSHMPERTAIIERR